MFRILIADRQDDLLWALQHFLLADDPDLLVRVTSNGDHAVELLEKETFDLLITELKLHGNTDGFQLLSRGRDLFPSLRIVVSSTLNEETTKRLGRRIGADVLLQKPYSLSSITEAVQFVRQQQHRWASRRLSRAGLYDLIEMICSKRRTALIRLKFKNIHGLIAVDNGEITHATYDNLEGVHALAKMIALEKGEIHLNTGVSLDVRTIHEPWKDVLKKVSLINDAPKEPPQVQSTHSHKENLSFGSPSDSMVSSVVSRTQRIYRDFPTLRENADEFVRRCPGILAYGLLRLNEVFSLSFQMSSGKRDFSDSQLIAYLDQLANVARSTSRLYGEDMLSRFAIELSDVMVVLERIYQSKYAQVAVFNVDDVDSDFVTLLMTQMGANYSLALGGVER